jgi:hypothetical protein
VPGERFALVASAESTSKLVCQAISLGGGLPAYVGEKQAADVRADEAVLGLLFESRGDGKRMAYLPAGSVVGRSAAVAGILRASGSMGPSGRMASWSGCKGMAAAPARWTTWQSPIRKAASRVLQN